MPAESWMYNLYTGCSAEGIRISPPYGFLRGVRWEWDEPGAATPFANAQKALSGLEYENGNPW